MVQQTLIVGDHKEPATRVTQGVHTLGHQFHRIHVQTRVRLVQDTHLGFQHRHLQDLVALFLTARETGVDGAFQHVGIDLQRLGLFAHDLQEVRRAHLFFAARLALGVHGGAQEGHVTHTRNFDRILERKEQTGGGALFGLHLQQVLTGQRGRAVRDLIAVLARQDIGQGRFTGPVRAHDCVHLAGLDGQVDTFEDLLILFFKFDVQVLDFQHFYLLGRAFLPVVFGSGLRLFFGFGCNRACNRRKPVCRNTVNIFTHHAAMDRGAF